MSEAVQVAVKAQLANKEAQSQKVQKPALLQSMDPTVDKILFLQRTIGNQNVEMLIRSGALQAKLRIGQPGDEYEQEADRVAEQVMRMAEPAGGGVIHRDPDAETERVRKLNEDYEQAVIKSDWPTAAELLNAFNHDDILARLRKLSRGHSAAIYVGATENPKVGPDAQVAQLSRFYYLDINFDNERKKGNWSESAKYLNGFNDTHIAEHVAKLDAAERQSLRAGAVAYDRIVRAIDAGPTAQQPATPAPLGTAYSEDDAKKVRDLWATGSYMVSDTNKNLETKEYFAWKRGAQKAITTLKKTLDAEKLKAITDWIARYEAHEQWALRKDGTEPEAPGAAPAELTGAASAKGTVGAPPTPAFRKISKYDVTIPGGGSISYKDNPVSPGYQYLLDESGVAASGKKLTDRPDADQIFDAAGITDATVRKAIKAVSSKEGGFEGVNTYDTGYVSVGMIQFTSGKAGGGSLIKLLKEYKKLSSADFETYFHKLGIDVDDKGLAVVDPATGAVLRGEPAVKKIMEDKRLTAVFQWAGSQARSFQAAQLKGAYSQYYMAGWNFTVKSGATTITGTYGEVLTSEAGKTALMDRAVQHGSGDAGTGAARVFKNAAITVIQQHGAKTAADLAMYEHEIVTKLINRINVLTDGSLSQPPAPSAAATGDAGGPPVQKKATQGTNP